LGWKDLCLRAEEVTAGQLIVLTIRRVNSARTTPSVSARCLEGIIPHGDPVFTIRPLFTIDFAAV
jgi:hypothetical protein